MQRKTTAASKLRFLKKQAEKILSLTPEATGKAPAKDIQKLVHDLQVHQIEIELQTEELQKTQLELEESNARYTSLYELAPVGYFTFDKKGIISEVNLTGAKLIGIEKPALIGKPLPFLSSSDGDRFYLHINETKRTGEPQICELALTKGSQDTFYVQLESVAVMDIEGFACRTAMIDITGRKQAEEEVKENEKRFHSLFDNVSDSIMVFDSETKIFEGINESVVTLFGYDKEEFLSLTPADISAEKEETVMRVQKVIDGSYEKGETLRRRMKRKDGTTFIAEINPGAFLFKGRKKIFGVVRDITEREQAEKEHREMEAHIQQTQKLESIGVLAGGISHDFNNILHNIGGFIFLLKGKINGDSKTTLYLNVIDECIKRGKNLAQQVLTFSRQSIPVKKPLDIKNEIEHTLSMILSTLPDNIEIKRSLIPGNPLVNADATHIHQVIMNLCINAIHAMPDGGVLEIGLALCMGDATCPVKQASKKMGDSCARLTISDTGKGIDKTIKHRIFDPFFTTKGADNGTGLGLSVVHGIIRDHDGIIEVQSEPNHGTTFVIHLPATTDTEKVAKDPLLTTTHASGDRILFIDDEEATVAWMSETLEQFGYIVTSYNNSVKALEAFINNNDQYDVVITDLTMPTLNGIDLATKIKNVRPDIPVLLCTGYSNEVTPEEIEEAGIREILMKPVSGEAISDAIHRIVQAR